MVDRPEAELRAALAALLPGRQIDRLERIAGGLGSDTYRADSAGERFVVKRVLPGSQRLLSLEQEAELIAKVAKLGLGPALVGVDGPSAVLVTEFVADLRPMSPEDVRIPAKLELIASCLKDLHGVDIDLPRFLPSQCADSYIRALGGESSLTPAEKAMAREVQVLSAAFEQAFDESHPCHNDLVAENLLLGQRLMLVDFEYSQASTVLLDLASLAAMNELSPEHEEHLVHAYDADAPISMVEFAKVRRLVTLLAHFWARVWGKAQPVDVRRFILSDVTELQE